jgi:MmyB-like transcription regulator ligand binding domain
MGEKLMMVDEIAPRRVKPPANCLERPTELRKLLVQWRRRINPATVPGLISSGRTRRIGHLSQEDVSEIAKVSLGWYKALERGCLDRAYSAKRLDRVAAALQLNTGERRVLYLLVTEHEPKPRPYAPAQITAAMQASLDLAPWPAFIVDATWEILACNAATLTWFPMLEWETNLMRLILTYHQMRMQIIDWPLLASLMLAQLRAQLAKMPNHQGLKALITEILEEHDELRHMWEDEPQVYIHDDGDQWRLLLPGGSKPTTVEVQSWMPMGHPDLRASALVPTAGFIPAACQERYQA